MNTLCTRTVSKPHSCDGGGNGCLVYVCAILDFPPLRAERDKETIFESRLIESGRCVCLRVCVVSVCVVSGGEASSPPASGLPFEHHSDVLWLTLALLAGWHHGGLTTGARSFFEGPQSVPRGALHQLLPFAALLQRDARRSSLTRWPTQSPLLDSAPP